MGLLERNSPDRHEQRAHSRSCPNVAPHQLCRGRFATHVEAGATTVYTDALQS